MLVCAIPRILLFGRQSVGNNKMADQNDSANFKILPPSLRKKPCGQFAGHFWNDRFFFLVS